MCRPSSSVSSECSPSASPRASAFASPAWKVEGSPANTRLIVGRVGHVDHAAEDREVRAEHVAVAAPAARHEAVRLRGHAHGLEHAGHAAVRAVGPRKGCTGSGPGAPAARRRGPQPRNLRIAAWVSRGASSWGTWPQSSSTCLAAGRHSSTCFMKAIGTSVSLAAPDEQRARGELGHPGPEAVLAVRLVEVDAARRGVERGAAARVEVRAQELVDARVGPAALGAHEAADDALDDRPRRDLEQAQLGPQRLDDRRPAAVAQPGERRAEQHQARPPARWSMRPASITTRPPMLLPTRCACSRSSASISSNTDLAK